MTTRRPQGSTHSNTTVSCTGYCARCGREHVFYVGGAGRHCLDLMRQLEARKRIDLSVPDELAAPRFSTDSLFGEARGQMFGVMAYRAPDGTEGTARAFSGQYNGVWEVDGWAPPLLDVDELERVSSRCERIIKSYAPRIEALPADDPARHALKMERRAMSRSLMKDIHAVYEIPDFRGNTASIFEAFTGANGIPTGTADCCAPKLLGFAANNGLIPLGIAEFYWGRENRSGRRRHGRFYASCKEKCYPILGHMLCGLEELHG